VWLIVARLHVGSAGALLEARLGHAQRRIFGRYVALEALNVLFLFGYFLKGCKVY
jgi:hypothetical protein